MSRAFDCRTLHAEPFSVGSPRVLYASDLSARSEGALRAAALLANRVEGQLTIGHVLPPRAASHVRTGAQKRLRRYAATAPLRAGSVLAFAIRSGSVSKTVAQLATETDAGMIVMGCQTRRPLAALFGTTAERVVRLAGRPALIVNSKGSLRYDKLVIAADPADSVVDLVHLADQWRFLDVPEISIVRQFGPIGPLFAERHETLLAHRHVERWKGATSRRLLDGLAAAGFDPSRFDVRIEEGYPRSVVRQVLRGSGSPLLILGAKTQTVFGRAMKASLANDALLSRDCDVLLDATRTRAYRNDGRLFVIARVGGGDTARANTRTGHHPEYPLERLCTHLHEPFQLKFARHAGQLLSGQHDVRSEPSHRGFAMHRSAMPTALPRIRQGRSCHAPRARSFLLSCTRPMP